MTGRSRHDQAGAATAELAMVLPLLVAVTVALIWLLAVALAQLRTVDAARETARALARGDDETAAVGRGLAVAPPGSHVAVGRVGGEITVTVTGTVLGPGGLLARLPSPRLSAVAVAADESADQSAGASEAP